MSSLSLKKATKLSDYFKTEDGSYLLPIVCNITHKDQQESSANKDFFGQPKRLSELNEFLGFKNTNYKYKWNSVCGSTDNNDLKPDSFICELLTKSNNLNEITKICRNLLNSNSSKRITIETNFYDQTLGFSKNSALNVSIRLLSPVAAPRKTTQVKKETRIEEIFKPAKRPSNKDNEKKRKKSVSFKSLEQADDSSIIKEKKQKSKKEINNTLKPANNLPKKVNQIQSQISEDCADNSVCNICGRKFSTERGVNQHKRLSHK